MQKVEIINELMMNQTKRNSLGTSNGARHQLDVENGGNERRKTLAPSSAKPPLAAMRAGEELFIGSLDQYVIGKQIGQGAYANVRVV
jgi:hypothetical protein